MRKARDGEKRKKNAAARAKMKNKDGPIWDNVQISIWVLKTLGRSKFFKNVVNLTQMEVGHSTHCQPTPHHPPTNRKLLAQPNKPYLSSLT